jgi:hypothetical protein
MYLDNMNLRDEKCVTKFRPESQKGKDLLGNLGTEGRMSLR